MVLNLFQSGGGHVGVKPACEIAQVRDVPVIGHRSTMTQLNALVAVMQISLRLPRVASACMKGSLHHLAGAILKPEVEAIAGGHVEIESALLIASEDRQ